MKPAPKYVKDLQPGDIVRLYDDNPDHEWGNMVKIVGIKPSSLPKYTFIYYEDHGVELLPSEMLVSPHSMIRYCYL